MSYTAFAAAFLSFALTWYMTSWLIRFLNRIDLRVKDMNKRETPLVPLSGGLAVLSGFFGGLMTFLFFRTFFENSIARLLLDSHALTLLFAATTTILLATFVGFVDDLIIKRNKESSSGLRQWQKPLLTLAAAVPLMVVNAGETTMGIPFLGGEVDMGILYPLVLIPFGVVGATNMVNMLAGFNGLEAGLGLIYMGSLGLYAFAHGSYLAALIALMVFSSLLGFYVYNRYPARILPGDSLTYLLGAALACVALVGNMERAAVIIPVPFCLECLLKAQSGFKAHSYGFYKKGAVQSRYTKIYSLPHLFTRGGRFTERQVVYFLFLVQAFFAGLIWVV